MPLALPDSLALMALFMILAGLALTPLLSLPNQIVSVVAVPGTEAEAYAWPCSSTLVRMAIGAAIAGQVIENRDWRAGMLTSLAGGVCVATINVANRRAFPDLVLAVTPVPTGTATESQQPPFETSR